MLGELENTVPSWVTSWVLVVDDDAEVRRIVRRGLEQQGCQVVEAPDAATALAVAGEVRVDVAVLDRQLPGMSGLDLLAELRRTAPSTHIIMLSGAAAEADRVQGLTSGADDYMVKPFSARELAARVVSARRRNDSLTVPAAEPERHVPGGVADRRAVGEATATVVVEQSRIVYANESAVLLFGADCAGQLVGQEIFPFVAAESIEPVRRRYLRAHGSWSTPEVIVLVRVDGRRQPVLVASSRTDWNGRPASQVSLWAQATSPTADASRDPSRDPSVGADADAVVVLDARGCIRGVNPAAELLYGWTEDEVQGRRLDECIGSAMSKAELDALHACLDSHGRWQAEVNHRRRDGSTVRVRSSSTLLTGHRADPGYAVLVNTVLTAPAPGTDQRAGDLDLVRDLRRGIERREFVVHYQPIVRLADARVVGVEALVRWQHPDRGLLFPAAFIDTAERTGAIVELGAFVLRESLQQCVAWRQAGHDLYVSVNLSGSQLADTSLTSLIAASPLPEGQLWLEVTETSLVGDVARAGEILTSLTQLGAKISIDDFGTGWASMTYLREFPVHALKIDRSFVSGLGASEIDTAIATSVLSLGRELGLKVFAEGIETDTQHQRLRDLGCEYGQGYLFGRPVPPEQLALEA
jgi:PAS domain S-box-containing protein